MFYPIPYSKIPKELLNLPCPEPFVTKTAFFKASPNPNCVSVDNPVAPSVIRPPEVVSAFDHKAKVTAFIGRALAQFPEFESFDAPECVEKFFRAHPRKISEEELRWKAICGEKIWDDCKIARVQSVLDYMVQQEWAFGYLWAHYLHQPTVLGDEKLTLILKSEELHIPKKTAEIAIKFGRAINCYPLRDDADWVASWTYLQHNMESLKHSLVTVRNYQWRNAWKCIRETNLAIDMRCACVWINYCRRLSFLVAEAVSQGRL